MIEQQIAELLNFCRRFPVAKIDAERFIRHLSSVPQSLVDLRSKGWLGVILDRATDMSGAAPFEWVGADAERLTAEIAAAAVDEIVIRARGLRLPSVHILITPAWFGFEGMLEKAGATLLYHDLDMTHSDGGWGVDAPVPKGWKWTPVVPDLESQYIDVMRRSFGGLVGLYMPSPEDMIAGLRDPAVSASVLVDESGRVCAVTRCRRERRYIHAIARDPGFARQGLGQMALDEARRILGSGPIHLSVVKENQPAIRLYARLGFVVESELSTWSLPISKAPI
jgi:ribosomal protein S18 acetylase RimI-like enzyme